MKTKEQIINSMCMTYDHRWGLPVREDVEKQIKTNTPFPEITLMGYLTKAEKDFIHSLMKQIYQNDIEPYMTFKP